MRSREIPTGQSSAQEELGTLCLRALAYSFVRFEILVDKRRQTLYFQLWESVGDKQKIAVLAMLLLLEDGSMTGGPQTLLGDVHLTKALHRMYYYVVREFSI